MAPRLAAAFLACSRRWLSTSAGSAPSSRPSSPACGVSSVGAARSSRPLCGGQQGQPVRIHQHRHVAGQHRGQPFPGLVVGAHARAHHPGLDPPGGVHVLTGRDVLTRHGDHRLGPEHPDHGHRRRRGHETDHPGATADRPAHGQRGRTGEPLAAGHDPGHAPAVLVGVPARLGQQRPHVRGLQRAERPGDPGTGQARYRSARPPRHARRPGRSAGRVSGCRTSRSHRPGSRLPRPRRCPHPPRWAGPPRPPRPGARGQPGQRGLRLAQPAVAADAQQPVQDQVGGADGRRDRVVVRAGQPATRGTQRRGALLVHPRAAVTASTAAPRPASRAPA